MNTSLHSYFHLQRRPFFFGLLAVALLLGACRERQRLDLGYFSLEVPKGWKYIPQQGIDSFVGLIAMDGRDTLGFDFGWYSNPLDDAGYLSTNHTVPYMRSRIDGTPLPDSLRRNNEVSIQVDGREAKLVRPKRAGHGITGIYIDSVWQAGSGTDKLSISGENLSARNDSLARQAFLTLRFHPKHP